MNLHCGKSKEAGVPIQGPPSANKPSKKLKEADSTSSLGSSPKRIIRTKRRRKTSGSRFREPVIIPRIKDTSLAKIENLYLY
jgi:hypothetical protein